MREVGIVGGDEPSRSAPRPSWDPLHLLDGVREVALLVDPIDITAVTQRAFDDARRRCPGFETLPSARSICRRLRLSWRDLLGLAALPPETRAIALAKERNKDEPSGLDADFMVYALRVVAKRLGKSTLTPNAYDAERDALIAANRRRWRHGGQLWLPHADQVRHLAGSWDNALAQAGLAPGEKRGGQESNGGRVPTIIEVLDRCHDHYGVQGSYKQLVAFAQANGFPLKGREEGKPWPTYIEEWKESRRQRGLPPPNGPAPRGKAPGFSQNVGAALPGEHRRRSAPDFNDAVDWVVRYLQNLQPDELPSVRRYNAWAKRHNGAPWASEFGRHHGGWLTVVDAARAKLRDS